MEIGIVCVPFQTDMGRWGMARGPHAILDAGLITRLHASGHTVSEPIWIDFPNSERTRDTVTNLGRIVARTSAAVRSVLARDGAFALVLEGNCTRALGLLGGIAATGAVPSVVWFDAHGRPEYDGDHHQRHVGWYALRRRAGLGSGGLARGGRTARAGAARSRGAGRRE
jgi:arginase